MANGYTRQSAATISAGLNITSSGLNNEFNALANAMNASSGHNHDGTIGGGAPLPPQALSGYTAPGILVANSPTQFSIRQLVAGSGISITYPDGVSGNPTITCTVTGGGATIPGVGLMVSTDGATLTARTLVAGAGISITYPNGQGGNPVITNTGQFQNSADPILMQYFI